MNGIFKVLTAVLGVLAVIACLTTIGIVGYTITSTPEEDTSQMEEQKSSLPTDVIVDGDGNIVEQASAVPTITPQPEEDASSPIVSPTPTAASIQSGSHVHDYQETIVKKATCYTAGQIKYTCSECGDEYYVDIMSTGHVPDDWEIVREPTETTEGLRVKKCIYCDEIVASEPILMETTNTGTSDAAATTSPVSTHIHQYTASTEREPSCVLAGLRRYSCSCGSFYTEMIPAQGHIASDWTTAEEATTTMMGREQRTCSVCGVVLDSRPLDMVSPSPSASTGSQSSASASASASSGSKSTSSPSASPSTHKHSYASYVLKEANCTEKGIRSYVCSCGSSYAEQIELDMNKHTYRAVVIPATNTTQGYTVYTCIRCNASYYDNYTSPLDPVYANSIATATASPST